MKEFTFSKNSWHYRLVNKVGYVDEEITDLCSYTRQLCGVLVLLTVLCVAVGFLVLLPVTDFVVWISVIVQYGFVQPEAAALFFMLMCVVGCITGAAFGLSQLHKRNKQKHAYDENVPVKEPSFASVLYHKFKEKTCVKIAFK